MNKNIFDPERKESIEKRIAHMENALEELRMENKEGKEEVTKELEEEYEIAWTRIIRDRLNADPRSGVEFASLSGLSSTNITNIRSGATIRISARSIVRLAKPLGYDVISTDTSTGEVIFEVPKKEEDDSIG